MMGNHALAIGDFSEAIKFDSKYAEALFCLGTSKLKLNQVEEAYATFEPILPLQSAEGMIAQVFDGIGQCLHALKKHEDALSWFDDAIKKESDDSKVFSYLRNRTKCFICINSWICP